MVIFHAEVSFFSKDSILLKTLLYVDIFISFLVIRTVHFLRSFRNKNNMSKAATAIFQSLHLKFTSNGPKNQAVSYLINHAWYLHVSTNTDQYTCTVSEFEVHK